MTRALAVVFYGAGSDPDSLFRTIWRPWVNTVKKYAHFIDRIHLVGNFYEFTAEELALLPIPYTIEYCTLPAALAVDCAVKNVTEDQFLLIHPDCIIYNPDVVKRGFDLLDEYDCAAIFDGSGKPLYQEYALFKENENRGNRCRLCNYLWFGKTQTILSIPNWTFEEQLPEYSEAASLLTEQLMKRNARIQELQDDRSNIVLDMIPGQITSSQWVDSPDKKWGREHPLHLGYYHIRNFNQGPELLKFWNTDRASYTSRIAPIPRWELLRILMWSETLGKLDMRPILDDLHVDYMQWEEYKKQFLHYHDWINDV